MKITEIERTKSEGPVDKTDVPRRPPKLPKGIKSVPGAANLGYIFAGGPGQMRSMFTGASHQLALYDLKNSAQIGWLNLRGAGGFPLPNSYQVANTQIYDAYRGQGLGQSLYGVALKVLGIVLVADYSQTPEARRLWANLHRIPGVDIRGWIQFQGQDVVHELDKYQMSDIKGNLRRIAKLQDLKSGQKPTPLNIPTDPLDDVYYDFPVQSGLDGKELQADKKGAAIYTNYPPEDNPRNYDVGLYARWTGK